MHWRILQDGPAKVYALVFDVGDEVVATLTDFAKTQSLSAAHFEAIGAFSRVTLGYFEIPARSYRKNPLDEQVEVMTLLGNIALADGVPKIHSHVVVGTRDGLAHGGHLLEGWVDPTLELVLTEEPAHLQRYSDPRTGLALLRV